MANGVATAPSGSVRAVDRALAIVQLLAEERRPLAIIEISKATGLSPATVHRSLSTLLQRDWVEQNPRTSRYRLGFGLLGTAAAALNYTPLVQRAQNVLIRMSAVSEYHSWLGVLVGRRVAYLAKAEGVRGRRTEFSVGVHQPAHAQSAGKILLADLSSTEIKRLYRGRKLRTYNPATISDLTRLEEELHCVAVQGYAVDIGEIRESARTVSVPVRRADGRLIASLTTGGYEADLDYLLPLIPELKFLAEELALDMTMDDD